MSDENFLGTLSEWERRTLQALTAPRRFRPGEETARQGERSDEMLVVMSGALSVTQRQTNGRTLALGKVTAGGIVGEIGLLLGIPRTAGVTADTDVEAIAIDRDGLSRLVEHAPGVACRLLLHVARAMARRTLERDAQLANDSDDE